jgi:NADPH:quinone reductase-like Zn-dependent oxidoreductase
MRAYLLEDFDTDPLLADAPRPAVGEGDVLVRVHAASLNPHDDHVATGAARAYVEYSFPMPLGTDFAGEVLEVGSAVSRFAPRDRVFGMHSGSFAELIAVPEQGVIAHTPEALDDLEASSLGLAGVTALSCLAAVAPSAGEWVFVYGGTGGVGSYLAQIARSDGWRMITTARSSEKAEFIRELGAEDVIDPTAGDLATRVRELAPDGVHVLIDLVDRDPAEFATVANGLLAPGGRAASTLMAADPGRLNGIQAANVFAMGLQTLPQLLSRAQAGTLRAPVTTVFSLDQIADAFAALKAGAQGKIVVRVA